MGDWDPFGNFHNLLSVPLIDGVAAMNAALAAYVAPVLRLAVPLAFALTIFMGMLRPGWSTLAEAMYKALLGLVVLTLVVEASVFGDQIRRLMLQGPAEIGQTLAGALGSRPVTSSLWWELVQRIWASGLAAYKALPWSFMSIPLGIVIVLYWVIGIAAMCFGFFLWEQSFALLALLTAVWPVFIPMAAFKVTKGWAHGYANTAFACAVFQFLAAVVVALLLTVLTHVLAVIVSAADRGREIEALLYVVVGGCIVAGAGWLVWRLNGLSNSIGHGYSGSAASVGRVISGRWGRGQAKPQAAPGGGGTSGPSSTPTTGAAAATRRVHAPPAARAA